MLQFDHDSWVFYLGAKESDPMTAISIGGRQGPTSHAPVIGASYGLDTDGSGVLTIVSGTNIDFPTPGHLGARAMDCWVRPPGRPVQPGDVFMIQPHFTVEHTATVNQPTYLSCCTIVDGAVVSSVSGGILGVREWQVPAATAVGAAHARQITAPVFYKATAADIDGLGGIRFRMKSLSAHTAGTVTIGNFLGLLQAYGPAELRAYGPLNTIVGTNLIFDGQSLLNSSTTETPAPYRIVSSLLTDGYEVGWSQHNWSGTEFTMRDGYEYMARATANRYQKNILVSTGGASDLTAGNSAATVYSRATAALNAYGTIVDYRILCTVPAAVVYTTDENTQRLAYNALLLADAVDDEICDAVVDMAGLPGFDDYTSDRFQVDETHLSDAGHQDLADAILPVLEPQMLT